MYLLVFQQNYDRKYVGIFDDVKKARKTFSKLAAYRYTNDDGYEEEFLDPSFLSDYEELKYKGKILPPTALQSLIALFVEQISKFSADFTSFIKSKVTEWIRSQASFIQDLFVDFCWES